MCVSAYNSVEKKSKVLRNWQCQSEVLSHRSLFATKLWRICVCCVVCVCVVWCVCVLCVVCVWERESLREKERDNPTKLTQKWWSFFSCVSPTTSSMQSLSFSLFYSYSLSMSLSLSHSVLWNWLGNRRDQHKRTHSPRKTPSLARAVIDLNFGSSSLRVLQPCRAAKQKSGQCSLLLMLLLPEPGMLEKWRCLVPNGPGLVFPTFLPDLTYT